MDNSKLYISEDSLQASRRTKLPTEIWIAAGVLLFVTLGLGFLAFRSKSNLDASGWSLVVGMFILTIIIAIGSLMFARQSRDSDGFIPLDAVFSEHGTAFLVRDARGTANRSQ